MEDLNKDLKTDLNNQLPSDDKATLRSAISYTACVLKRHNVSKTTHYCYTCKRQH